MLTTLPTNQLTDSVIMVRPVDFGFNPETGEDNEFQNKPCSNNETEIQQLALQEFNAMVSKLNLFGVQVIVLDRNQDPIRQPDAVFPNNWFSTRHQNQLVIYPMKTPNRRAEVQVSNLVSNFSRYGFNEPQVIDFREVLDDKILEGTGCLIFQHSLRRVYAAISERCHPQAVDQFAERFSYQALKFNSKSATGSPIYHTNVLMSCGDNFAVIADDVIIKDADGKQALSQLEASVTDLIRISEQQMAKHFCGNILQLKNAQGEPAIVMSGSAYQGFTPEQRSILEKHGELLICDIPTIESIGGGSARCMIAENFLPKPRR